MDLVINSVHTVFSAEGLKIGSRGYFADTLEEAASLERDNTGKELHTLTGIDLEQLSCFTDEAHTTHRFFYLVEDPVEPVEVTAKEWDNRPRIMKVWKDNYYEADICKVVAVRYSEVYLYPVVALDASDSIRTFKHCADIEQLKEPEAEKHYRPYNNADEFIEDYKRRFCPDCKGIPAIWVRNKEDILKQVIGMFNKDVLIANDGFVSYSALLEAFTYPDGSPCGMEE